MSKIKDKMPYYNTTRLGKGKSYRKVAAGSRARIERFGVDRTITAKIELQDPNIVMMLGEEPVYIHSHKTNFEMGLNTIWSRLKSQYDKVRYTAIDRANKVADEIKKQEDKLVKYINKESNTKYNIYDVIKLFNESDKNFGDDGISELFKQLNYLKEWLTLLNLGKTNKEWDAFIKQENTGLYCKIEGAYQKIMELSDKILKINKGYLTEVAIKQIEWMRDNLGKRLDTDKSPVGFMHMATGKVIEVIDENIKKKLVNTAVEYRLLNSAQEAEHKSKTKSKDKPKAKAKGIDYVEREGTGSQKIDNVILIDKDIIVYTTDKTGRVVRADGKSMPSAELGDFTEKTFNATSKSSNLFNSERQVVELNLEELGDVNLLKYVAENSTYFNNFPRATQARTMIAAMYYWNRIFVEIIGKPESGKYPTFIRNFGEYYRVIDLLNYIIKKGQVGDGSEVMDKDIVTGADKFINRKKNFPKYFYNKKSMAIRRIISNGTEPLNYETLKKELSSNLPRKVNLSINLAFKIALNNLRVTSSK